MHAQNFWTGSTYDNVHQRMPTYGSVSVTYEKRIPGVCNVHQRSSSISHTSAYVGAIRCSVTALLNRGFSSTGNTQYHMYVKQKSFFRESFAKFCINHKVACESTPMTVMHQAD